MGLQIPGGGRKIEDENEKPSGRSEEGFFTAFGMTALGVRVVFRTLAILDVVAGWAGLFYILSMPPVVCSICDRTETECKCDRYCCICGGQEGIRLCMDGLYYCPDCREACEMSTASMNAP